MVSPPIPLQYRVPESAVAADLALIGSPVTNSPILRHAAQLENENLVGLETHPALAADEPAYYWQGTLTSYLISSHPSKSEIINAESGLG